ncbi:hypothetical protein OE88DRAFT_875349 [Heliocybe sulcata]|uniref:Uncharacterized protein n=1 Tax=Heliocybe sulcata TaxID=5364 RepID=A0A5C3MS68_9AGAM|nr:hypothetical protein OE88DRAFT_875349 [Heliocybe sulcata]
MMNGLTAGENSQAQAADTASSAEGQFNPYAVTATSTPYSKAVTPYSTTPGTGASYLGYSPFLAAQTSADQVQQPQQAIPTATPDTSTLNNTSANSAATLPVAASGHDAGKVSTAQLAPARFRSLWAKVWRWCHVHWLILCLIATVLCVAISVPVGWALRLRSFQDAVDTGKEAIELEASLIAISLEKQSMTIDWNIYMSADGCSNYANTAVSLYFDENLLRSSSSSGSSTPSNNRPSTPVFVLNTTEACSTDAFANSPYFRTEIAILSDRKRTAQSYPFEKYHATIFMFASLPDNTTFPEVGIVTTYGIAVGFNAQLERGYSGAYNDGTYQSLLTVTRGPVIRVYAIAIVIAIWLVTLTFLATCIAVVFLHRSMSATVLVLPIATLFAFTQLRSTLPGAPTGFGADIDFVGILPCLAIITFCAVLMTGVFLFANPEKYDVDGQIVQDKEKQD